MPVLEVARNKCTGCRACSGVCPLLLWELGEDCKIRLQPDAGEKCIACGHCAAVCPVSAITLDGRNAASLGTARGHSGIDESFLSLVRSRRSTRAYAAREVEKDTITELIDLTRFAPTARNRQPVNWTVIYDPERVHTVAGMAAKVLAEKGVAPEVMQAWESGIDLVNRGAPHLVLTHTLPEALAPVVDCAIALTTFELAAASAGLATCWAGFFMIAANDPEIRAFCGVPDGQTVHGAMMLGYPKYEYQRVPERGRAKINWC